MSVSEGLICKFIKNSWRIDADGSPPFYESTSVDTLLSCSDGSYHSTNNQNSYVQFTFSKPILVFSYIVYSRNLEEWLNYLYNWELKYLDIEQNTWKHLDSKSNFDTRGNQNRIAINDPVKLRTIKLIGGSDREGDSYFLKFDKIEFYGIVFYHSTCKKNFILKSYLAFIINIMIIK